MKEIYKFWWTSVDHLEQVANIIVNNKDSRLPHACVSAFSWVTDLLLNLIESAKYWKDCNNLLIDIKKFHIEKINNWIKNKDFLKAINSSFINFFDSNLHKIEKHLQNISTKWININNFDPVIWFWEQISAFLLSITVSLIWKSKSTKWKYIDLWKVVTKDFKVADKIFIQAVRSNIATKIIEDIDESEIPIITGYFWKVPWWILNSIDRWYTDFTASLVASVISAKKLVIFKEVDWICSADPKIVKERAVLLKRLSYLEVLKMASSWMKAINTEAVKPAMSDNIPIEVRNTFYPDRVWTHISSYRDLNPNVQIQTIPSKKWVCILRFGWLNDWFMWDNLWQILSQMIKKHKIKRFFSTSDDAWFSVVLKFEKEKIEELIDDLKSYANVRMNYDCAIVWIVWEEMRWNIWTFTKAANAISWNWINMHMVAQWASEISIAFVIDESDSAKAINAIHEVFFA